MKKKNILIVSAILISGAIFAQEGRVGINTETPKTTLDVSGKTDTSGNLLTTDVTGLQAPRLTRADLTAKGNALYGADQKGALVYITDITGGDVLSQRVNITAIGYYYFDGLVWQKIGSGSGATTADWYKFNTSIAAANGDDQFVTGSVAIGQNSAGIVATSNSGSTAMQQLAKLTVANGDALINGLTIGKGGGQITTNTAIGNFVLSNNTTGSNNIGIGYIANASNTTGEGNIAIGFSALAQNSIGNYNIAIGDQSLLNSNSYSNVGIGQFALQNNIDGIGNNAIGENTFNKIVSGYNNTALGLRTGYAQLSGNQNTYVGSTAGAAQTSGDKNTYIGDNAGSNQITGNNNIVLGRQQLKDLNGSNQLNIGGAIFGTGMTGSAASPAGNIGIGTSAPTKKIDINGEARIRTLPIIPGGTPMVADADGNVGIYKVPDPNDFILYHASPNIRQNNSRQVPLTSILNVPQTNAQDGGGSTIQPANCWIVPNSEVIMKFPVGSSTQRGLASWNLWFEMSYNGGLFSKTTTDGGDKFKIPLFFHNRLYARVYKKDPGTGIFNQINIVTVSMRTEQISPYFSEATSNDTAGNPYATPGSFNPNYRYFISASYSIDTNNNPTAEEEYKIELLFGIENFSSQAPITDVNFLQNWGIQSVANSYFKK